MEALRESILALNTAKNKYAEKKIAGNATPVDDKDLVSHLIYVISECRGLAQHMGISADGKFSVSNNEMENFRHVNVAVSNLKAQILMLVESSVDALKTMIRKECDSHAVAQSSSQSSAPDDKIKQRLRDKIKNKIVG